MSALRFAPFVLCAACGSVAPATDARIADAHDPDAAQVDATRRCDPTAPFDAPVLVAGLDSPSSSERRISLSPDELTVYVAGFWNGSSDIDIDVATRGSLADAFSAPAPLAAVNTTAVDGGPSISADGLTFFLSSTRIAGVNDIFVATRTSTIADFSAPALVANVNSSSSSDDDTQPFLTADGEELWFVSDRAGGAGAHDLYVSTRTANGFSTPSRVPELSSADDDWMPVLSADRLTVYFSSTRAPSQSYDIWTSHRTSTADGFPAPTRVTELATSAEDHPSWLSADNCRLYLWSAIAGDSNVYVAVRHPQ